MILNKFLKQFNGSSFPTLVETTQKDIFVMKIRGSGNGSKSLLAEFIANSIGAELSPSIPRDYWINIENDFPWTFGTDEFEDIVLKSMGWNLAIDFIDHPVEYLPDEIENNSKDFLSTVFTIDLFFNNIDRISPSYNFLKDTNGKFWIIDHGALGIFYFKTQDQVTLQQNHFLQERERKLIFDPRILNIEKFEKYINIIPDQILLESNVSKIDILTIIKKRVNFLRNHFYNKDTPLPQ